MSPFVLRTLKQSIIHTKEMHMVWQRRYSQTAFLRPKLKSKKVKNSFLLDN